MYEKMLAEYAGSAGSAMTENEVRMDSWQAKTNQLTNTVSEFWNNAINTNAVKGFIDGLNGLIKVLDVLINNSFSSFLIQIALTSAAIYGLGLGIQYLTGTTAISGLLLGIGRLINSLKLLSIGASTLSFEFAALTASMLASPLFGVVIGTAVIVAIIKGVTALTTSIKEQKEAVQTLSSDLQGLQSEYDKLSAKDNKTPQEEKHLAVLQAQIDAQKTLLAQETKRLINRQYSNDTEYQTDVFMSTSDESNDINKNVADLKQYNEELSNLNTTSDGAYEKEQQLKKSIAESTNSLSEKYKTILSNKKILEDVGEQESEEYKTLTLLSGIIEEVIKNTTTKTDETNKSVQATKDSTTATNAQTESFKNFAKTFKDSSAIIKQLNGVLDELDKGEGLSASTIDSLLEKHGDLAIYLGDEAKLREKLNGLITDETNKVREAYIASSMSSEAFYKNNQTIVQSFFNDLKTAYGIDIGNWKTLSEAKKDIDLQLIKTLGANWAKYYDIVSGAMTAEYKSIELAHSGMGNITESTPELEAEFQKARQISGMMNDISSRFNNAASTGFNSIKLDDLTSTKDKSPSTPDQYDQYALKDYKENIEKADNALKLLDNNKSHLVKTSTQYQDALKQEITLLTQKQSLAHNEANRLRGVNSGLDSQIQSVSGIDWNNSSDTQRQDAYNSLSNKNKKVLNDLTKDYDTNQKAILDAQGSYQDWQKTIEDNNFEIITSKISAFDKAISDTKDSLDNSNSELDNLIPGTAEYKAKLEEITTTTKQYIQALKDKQTATQAELLNTNLSAVEQENLKNIIKETTKEIRAQQLVLESQLKSLASEVVQIYKDIYSEQEDIALGAIDKQKEAEEDRHKTVSDNLDSELSQYNDIIDAKLKLLDETEDEEQYQKDLTKAQQERQDIQNKIDILSLDDSPENKIKLAELKVSLAEKDEDIEDLQHDHTLSLRKKNLESLKTEKQKEVDLAKDTEDELYDATKERLDDQKELVEKYWDNIINDEERWMKLQEQIINGDLSQMNSDFATFKSWINGHLEEIGNSIATNLTNRMKEAIVEAGNYSDTLNNITGNTTDNTTTPPVITPPTDTTPKKTAYITKAAGSIDYIVTSTSAGGESSVSSSSTSLQNLLDMLKTHGFNQYSLNNGSLNSFHTGGIVGEESSTPSRITQLVNQLLNTNANEEVLIGLKKEVMAPQSNLFKFFTPNMQNLISSLTPQVAVAGGNNIILNVRVDNMVANSKKHIDETFSVIVKSLGQLGVK